MIRPLDREGFGWGTKLLTPSRFPLRCGLFLDDSAIPGGNSCAMEIYLNQYHWKIVFRFKFEFPFLLGPLERRSTVYKVKTLPLSATVLVLVPPLPPLPPLPHLPPLPIFFHHSRLRLAVNWIIQDWQFGYKTVYSAWVVHRCPFDHVPSSDLTDRPTMSFVEFRWCVSTQSWKLTFCR